MMVRAALGLFVVLGQAQAFAADFGLPKEVSTTFNTYAKMLKRSPRMVLRKCADETETSCLFSIPGKVTVLTAADAKTPGRTQIITFGADRSSDPKQFVAAVQIAMFAFASEKEAALVSSTFKVLFATPLKEFSEAQIGDVKFTLKTIDGGGIFFSVIDATLKNPQ